MTLKIRLRQQGRKNQLMYRLVITDSHFPRDGKYIETLGWYNPLESEPEKTLCVCPQRLQHWLDQGAVLTEKAATLIKRGAPDVHVAYRKKLVEAKAKICQKKRALRKKKGLATT
jgi:small subunit ribosomal protein S16